MLFILLKDGHWQDGCRVERLTAILYGIEIITDEEKDEEIN